MPSIQKPALRKTALGGRHAFHIELSSHVCRAYSDYLDAAVSFARIHWTQFDDVSILVGITTFITTLALQLKNVKCAQPLGTLSL